MKVKVTKVMANHIAKVLKEAEFEVEEVSVQKMSERSYAWNVGTGAQFDAEYYGDYDWQTNMYKVIRIVYPWHYHAMPTYLTTKQLVEFCREANHDIELFDQKICDYVEI